MIRSLSIVLLASVLFLAGCASSIPKEALQLSPESLAMRQIQTRYYDTRDEAKVLSACAGLLQDLGFNIDESETELGFIIGSKERDAKSAVQMAKAFLKYYFSYGYNKFSVEDRQTMRGSIVTHPYGEKKDKIAVRVTFQRIVRDTDGLVTIKEGLTQPEIYKEFFAKLSKSLFLEAQEI